MKKINIKRQTKKQKIRKIPTNRKRRFQFAKEYFLNNIREYSIVAIMFLIGIFVGVMYINNIAEEKQLQVGDYLNTYIQNFKDTENINHMKLTKIAVQKNIGFSLLIWFAGTTIIGIPIVLGIILFRGGCLGVSIATCINTLGLGKGLSFVMITIFLQNIIFIPAIITMGVSSLNLYKTIVKDRRKDTIKLSIFKHTIISIAMLGILILSAIIEINVSCKILEKFIKYF